MYRTTPMKGFQTHTEGGSFHAGRFATLDAVAPRRPRLFPRAHGLRAPGPRRVREVAL